MPRKSRKSDSFIQEISKLLQYTSRRLRIQLAVLLCLLIVASFSEMVSLGAIFPFLSALSNAKDVLENSKFQPLFVLLNIQTPQQLIILLALVFIAAVVIANGLRLFTTVLQARLSNNIGAYISSKIFSIFLSQSYSFHLQQNSSDLIQTLTVDVERLTSTVIDQLLTLIANALLAPTLIIALLFIDGRVAIGAGVVLGGSYIIIYKTRQRLLKRNSKVISQAGQQKVKVVQEGIGGIRDILLSNSQAFFEHTYSNAEYAYKRSQTINAVIVQSPKYVTEVIALSAIALLALALGKGGDFSQAVPVLGSLALGAKRLLPALQQIFASIAFIQGSRESLHRVLLALQRPTDSTTMKLQCSPLQLKDKIQLKQVWFRYQNEGSWILKALDLTIPAKTTVGFVGGTGSGKSTTADLVLGLLQPQQGEILVDGTPLQGEYLHRWQNSIATVPQQIFLSDGTIAENIAFGIPQEKIDFAQVNHAARLAKIDTYIESLPADYRTYVGERGVRLSGGQRQRIGIARALYKNASIIVFDEATSALDNATEREVMAAIESLSGDFTIILIAHRLSTIQRCDCIFELSQGRIVAQGTYQDLIQKSSSFKQMAETV